MNLKILSLVIISILFLYISTFSGRFSNIIDISMDIEDDTGTTSLVGMDDDESNTTTMPESESPTTLPPASTTKPQATTTTTTTLPAVTTTEDYEVENPGYGEDCSMEMDPDACYFIKAMDNRDSFYCGKIEDAEYRDSCYDDLAFCKMDSDLCGNIKGSEMRDYCYWDIAVYSDNYKICASVEDDYLRDDCYYMILINVDIEGESYCDNFVTEMKEDCLMEFDI